jgi:lipoprotein-anchoring transpeptidase ErfK/SrfK
LPDTAGTFGSYWIALSCGFGIGIHGDYPSEDAKKILTKDAPATREPEPGEGSTHGCIRLYNKDVEEVATKYAEMKSGQYIKIEA